MRGNNALTSPSFRIPQVGCKRTINPEDLKQGSRVTLDLTTLTIMRILPREVRRGLLIACGRHCVCVCVCVCLCSARLQKRKELMLRR